MYELSMYVCMSLYVSIYVCMYITSYYVSLVRLKCANELRSHGPVLLIFGEYSPVKDLLVFGRMYNHCNSLPQ